VVGSLDAAVAGLSLPPGLRRLAIAVPDLTRPLDTVSVLATLRRALGERAPAEITVVVGLGLHRPLTEAELSRNHAACGWPVVNSTPDDTADLGLVHGIPCQVAHPIAEAEMTLAIGVVELHQYAGFSGGHKASAVGCGGRDTLAALHARAMVCDPEVQVGRVEGNPFREAVDALGEHNGTRLALLSLGDGRWTLGEPRAALRVAAAAQDPWWTVPEPVSACILRVPEAKAANFYQASRAATYLALSPSPPLVDGARIVLDASCPDGAGDGDGERAFGSLMAMTAPPWQSLLTGPVPSGAGLQRAFMLARLAQRYHLIVAGCDQPEALQRLGVEATSSPASAVAPGALTVNQPFTRLPQLRRSPPASGTAPG